MRPVRPYCYQTPTLRGFIQQIAVSYVRWGYFFYTLGEIPRHKDPAKTDEKILGRYNLRRSRWSNARSKEQGRASVQYLRFEHTFVLMATHGAHLVKEEEELRDLRKEPMNIFGYSISYRKRPWDRTGHVSVRIQKPIYLDLKAHISELAPKLSVDAMHAQFEKVRFEAYAGVRSQMLNILREVNRRRKASGLEPVPLTAIRMRRKSVKVFGFVEEATADKRGLSQTPQ
jgi:hypothetical protein